MITFDQLVEFIMKGGYALIILAISFIKIPKIELNIWSLIGRSITKELVGKINEVEDSVKNVQEKLDEHISKQYEENSNRARSRILRFNDEEINGTVHTKESFDDILEAIDEYEKYCSYHPNYRNNRCGMAIINIKEACQKQFGK